MQPEHCCSLTTYHFFNIIQISLNTHNSVVSFIAVIKQMVLLYKCYLLAINSAVILDYGTPVRNVKPHKYLKVSDWRGKKLFWLALLISCCSVCNRFGIYCYFSAIWQKEKQLYLRNCFKCSPLNCSRLVKVFVSRKNRKENTFSFQRTKKCENFNQSPLQC